jgi:hypothetical protein
MQVNLTQRPSRIIERIFLYNALACYADNKNKGDIFERMGQSATLYQVTQAQFDRLSKEPSSFDPEMTEGRATFDQNFEGLIFLLSKLSTGPAQALVREIFYPGESMGRTIDPIDFDVLDDLSFLENENIGYLNREKINAIREILRGIDKRRLLELYNPKELNDNGVYPGVWHSHESADHAFNRRHIEEGFDDLLKLFNEAVENKSLILVFVN